MGRKIRGKHHRGVKHPEEQAARRLEMIAGKINCPPRSLNTQEVPKSVSFIQNFMKEQKEKKKGTQNEHTKKKKKRVTKWTKFKEKRAAKLEAKLKAKALKREDANDVKRENIRFGEVAHRPPAITYKIKSKTPINSLMEMPGRKSLLLKSKIEERKAVSPKSDLNQKYLEAERIRVAEMYKVVKQRRKMEMSLKKKE